MIFFDLDHTLLDLETAEKDALALFLRTSVLRERLPWEVFYPAWEEIRVDCFRRYLDGELTYEKQRAERMRRIHEAAEIELSEKESYSEFMRFHSFLRESWRLFPEAGKALERFGSRPLGLVTNGNARQQHDKLERLGLQDRFSYILTAEEAGCSKPDPRMFLIACEAAGEAPERCAYIGDHYETDIVPAESLGMLAVWVDRKGGALPENSRAVRVTDLIAAADETIRRLG